MRFFEKEPTKERERELVAYLLARHPALALGEIGKSTRARPLHCFRIGEGKQNVLYVGAHHGTEWITSLLLYRFLDDLSLAVFRRGMGDLLQKCTLFVIPMLNPDGVEIALSGSYWQANARGVDLNHNYDAGFAAYKSLEREAGITGPCPTRYSGTHPFSESETAALRDFLQETRPALTLTLHTQGEQIFYRPTLPPVAGARSAALALAALTGYRLGTAEGMAAYGGMSDYVAEVLRLPAFTLECGLGKNPLPITAGEGIYRRLRRALFFAPLLAQ